MNKLALSFLSLVLGVTIGVLVQRTLDRERVGRAVEHEEEVRIEESNRSKTPRDPTTESTGPRGDPEVVSNQLEELRSLLPQRFSGSPGLEFLQTLADLSPREISALLNKLEEDWDTRDFTLRKHLYSQWARLDPEGAWNAALEASRARYRINSISAVMLEVVREDPVLAEKLVKEVTDENGREAALDAFLTNLAEENPEWALRVFLECDGDPNSRHINQIFSVWADQNLETALAGIENLESPQARSAAQQGIAYSFVHKDPARALEMIAQMENPRDQSNSRYMLFGTIAANDPEMALKLLDQVSLGSDRGRVISSVSSRWLHDDPGAAMDWMKTLPRKDRYRAIRQGVDQMVAFDPVKAVDLVSSLPVSRQSSALYASLASSWVRRESDAAIAWAMELPPGRGRKEVFGSMYSTLSDSSPEKAARLFDGEGYHSGNSHYVGGIVANWAEQDREAAMAWVGGLPLDEREKRNVISQTTYQWANLNIEEAKDFAMSLPEGEERGDALSNLTMVWGSKDPEQALTWALENLNGETRIESIGLLMENLASNDSSAAMTMYEEMTAGLSQEEVGEQFGEVSFQIAQALSHQDPSSAGEWLLQRPANEQREKHLIEIVGNWAEFDQEGAAHFVMGLEEGAERDGVVEKFVWEVNQTDPESAFIWAGTISDEEKRVRQLKRTAMDWYDTDPKAVRRALEEASIPAEAKTQILDELE